MKTTTKPHVISAMNAQVVYGWIKERGGIAIWRSINLGNPGASWSAPVKSAAGEVYGKPNWQCGNEPERIITDPAEVNVTVGKEAKRFKIRTRLSDNGLTIKLDGRSSERVRRYLEKYQTEDKETWYEFDGDTCIIMVDDTVTPLVDYIKAGVFAKRNLL
jgi:hypothetical protein